jgi:hypothetical protein
MAADGAPRVGHPAGRVGRHLPSRGPQRCVRPPGAIRRSALLRLSPLYTRGLARTHTSTGVKGQRTACTKSICGHALKVASRCVSLVMSVGARPSSAASCKGANPGRGPSGGSAAPSARLNALTAYSSCGPAILGCSSTPACAPSVHHAPSSHQPSPASRSKHSASCTPPTCCGGGSDHGASCAVPCPAAGSHLWVRGGVKGGS